MIGFDGSAFAGCPPGAASKLKRARRVTSKQRKESGERSIHDEGLPELLSKLENRQGENLNTVHATMTNPDSNKAVQRRQAPIRIDKILTILMIQDQIVTGVRDHHVDLQYPRFVV